MFLNEVYFLIKLFFQINSRPFPRANVWIGADIVIEDELVSGVLPMSFNGKAEIFLSTPRLSTVILSC